MKKKGNKGLSTIVVTLIMIVLALVAVGAVWIVVSNLLKGQSDQIALDTLNFEAGITALSIDNSTNNVSVTVERKVGEANFVGMKFYFYNDTGAEVITEHFALTELAQKRFFFHLNMNLSSLNKVSIVPLFGSKDGKENLGNVEDTYDVKSGVHISTENNPNCVPQTCSSLGYTCGTWINRNCSGTINCGTCNSTQTCPSGTCVNNPACTPSNYTYSCLANKSIRLDNCGGTQNVTCNSTQNCFANATRCGIGTCAPSNYTYTCSGNKSIRLDNCGIYQNVTCNATQICLTNSTRCRTNTTTCVPATCTSLGYTCGNPANGTCGGTLNCGSCSSGYTCISGQCVGGGEQTCDYYLQSGSTISQIQNIINNANPGKVICLQRGAVFSASDGISITNSGTSTNPITICASSNGVSCNEIGTNPKISITDAGEDVKGIEFRAGSKWIIVKHLDFEGINGGVGLLFSGTTPASYVSLLACNISRFNTGWMSDPWVQTTPPNYVYMGSCEYPLNIFNINVNANRRGSGGYGWFSNSVMAVNYKNTGSDGIFDHNVYFSSGPRAIPTQNMTFECGTYTDSSLDSDGVSVGLFLKLSGYHTGVIIRNNTFYDDKCHTYVIDGGTSNDGLVGEYAEAEIYNNVFNTPCPITISGTTFRNTKIYNNLFNYKNYEGGEGYFFISLTKADYSASILGNNEIYNNNFVCNERYCPDSWGEGFFINMNDQGSNNKFFNNLFYSNRSSIRLFESINVCNQFGINGADFNNNFIYSPNDATPGMVNCSGGRGNSQIFNINPQLRDALHGDYVLLSTSPLINKGRVGAPSFDFSNNPRDSAPDIGAFEYV
jgi:hypothetical protein